MKLSVARLKAQCLPENAKCSFVKVTVDGVLAGHALACRWLWTGKTVCWITQLVVHSDYRGHGLAIGLLNDIRDDGDDIYGLASSHVAACLAAQRAFGGELTLQFTPIILMLTVADTGTVPLDFIKENADDILKSSPVPYIHDAKLRGYLFDPNCTKNLVSCIDTNFFTNHSKPLEALDFVRETRDWPLGDLLEGHEFLLILPVRRRTRSLSLSTGSSSSKTRS